MKATTWKAVFATMSPSPVFEAIAEFAELRADHRRAALAKLFSRRPAHRSPGCEEASVPRQELAERVREPRCILLRIDMARRSFEGGVRF